MTPDASASSSRIVMVDALRGFALVGILLLHHLEHFGIFLKPENVLPWLNQYDETVHRIAFAIFLDKTYSIFALLFGFGFWMQYQKWSNGNYDYTWRFAWRMAVLFGIGLIHASIYGGDILAFYAILSFPLLIARNLSNRTILLFSMVLLASPVELFYLLKILMEPDYVIHGIKVLNMREVMAVRMNGSFLEVVSINFEHGIQATWTWMWNHFRVFQTPGLFLLGVVLARKRVFENWPVQRWLIVLIISISVAFLLHLGRLNVFRVLDGGQTDQAVRLLGFYTKLFLTFTIISGFVLAWNWHPLGRILKILSAYGRLSLTNYVLQGVTGTFLYFGYGLSLHRYCGPTVSILIGLSVLALQLGLSHFWLNRFCQGPLEFLWRRATWAGFDPSKVKKSEVVIAHRDLACHDNHKLIPQGKA